MDTRMFYPILFAVLILFALAALLIMRKRKSDQLKQRFGPEYDRVVQQHGNTRHAEFTVRHAATGQLLSVEAKSRHRARVDAHMICKAIEEGKSISGVYAAK